MKYYRCKCWKMGGWTSMGIRRCSWCKECKTTLSYGPDGHKTEQPAHRMFEQKIETDDPNGAIKTICFDCFKSKRELEQSGEPMEPHKYG